MASIRTPPNVDRVTVVGGGVIGLATAHFLREAGVDVVVLERDRVGSGASRGNAGEVCPGLCVPLPRAHVLAGSLRTLHRRDSALYVRPQVSGPLVRFMLGFAWNAREDRFEAGVRALAALSRDAVALYRGLEALGIELHVNDRPYLTVFPSAATAEEMRLELERLAGDHLEVPEAVTETERLRSLEPCLSGTGAAGVAGLEISGQLVLDPSALIDGLAAHLRSTGVEIREGTRVTRIERGAAVETTDGRVEADAVVLTAGVWSTPLAESLGVRLPIFPGKGYSFSVPIDSPPRHQIQLEAAHVVVTPLPETTRVAGTMEIDADHDRFDRRRIETMVAAARPYLAGVDWERRTSEWMGPRPMTPTGLPLIGPLGDSGRVFVAAGHNMFGVTLAPSTGQTVAALVTTGYADVDLTPFAPPGF